METIVRPHYVKARKDHPCNYCWSKISKGETYESSVYKMDGVVYQWKSHKDCQWIADELNMFDHCDEGLSDEAFQENIRIEFGNLELESLGNPTFTQVLSQVIEYHKNKVDKGLSE